MVRGGDGLFYLAVSDHHRGEGRRVTVGEGYATSDDVKAAYRGLCPEPAGVGA